MTVAELIAKLQEMPQDMPVVFVDPEAGYEIEVDRVSVEDSHEDAGTKFVEIAWS